MPADVKKNKFGRIQDPRVLERQHANELAEKKASQPKAKVADEPQPATQAETDDSSHDDASEFGSHNQSDLDQ
jgi:hypothetical protein